MLELAWPLAALALVLPWVVAYLAPPAPPLAVPLTVPFFGAACAWQSAPAGMRPRLRLLLALAAWAMLVAAACRPQWIGEPAGAPASGGSFLLALDLSASMDDPALGAKTGLEIAHRTAREFLAGRAGDRIGLVVFGSKAYVQAPPTFDLQALAAMVDEAFIGLAGNGTALGDGIALGVARLRGMPRGERVMVLLTDGASTEGEMTVPEAARLARRHGVRVHAIGIGALPTKEEPRPGMGLDEPALELVAAETGGRYLRAGDAQALERIHEALRHAEPAARDQRRYRTVAELYAWPLGLALALALGALLHGLRGARP